MYSVDELLHVLNFESGLKGISGISSDMREIERHKASGNPRAQLAFDIYLHSLTSNYSSLLPLLGGPDLLAFTGGVGENSGLVRDAACDRLRFLGLSIDQERNANCNGDADISARDSRVRIFVFHTREDLEIARECPRFL